MPFEDALKVWGAGKLEASHGEIIDPDSVNVITVADPGYNCCGGSDPSCYCSYATGATYGVSIQGSLMGALEDYWPENREVFVSLAGLDFLTLLREVVAAGGGAVSAA